jgi:hypothetical protein
LVVSDVDAATNRSKPVDAVFSHYERVKREKYDEFCRTVYDAAFEPFIMSHDGALAPAAAKLIKELAQRLAGQPAAASSRRGGDYASRVRWVRARLQLGALRYSSMCLRASRFKWRSVGLADGTALDYMLYRDR